MPVAQSTSTLTEIFETDYYIASHMIKNNSNVFVVQLKEIATDASSEQNMIPANTQRQVDQDGLVNYYDEPSRATKRDWKKKLGAFAVHEVVKRDMEDLGRLCKYQL